MKLTFSIIGILAIFPLQQIAQAECWQTQGNGVECGGEFVPSTLESNCMSTHYTPKYATECCTVEPPASGMTSCTTATVTVMKVYTQYSVFYDELLERSVCMSSIAGTATLPTAMTCTVATPSGSVCNVGG